MTLSVLIYKVRPTATNISPVKTNIGIIFLAYLPFLQNQITNKVRPDIAVHFSFISLAIVLPIFFYFSIKMFQILKPHAIDLIASDRLEASTLLKESMRRVVTREFEQTFAHRWAIYIHGKILTRLAATSLRLQSATDINDIKGFRKALAELIELLKSPDISFDEPSKSLKVEIDSRLDPWQGILNVSCEVDPELESLESKKIRELGEVLEEAIANANRHGQAKNLLVRVMKTGDNEIEINLTDDAIRPLLDSPKRSGLGTQIFNLVSDGRWSLTRSVSGTEFKLWMRIKD